MFKVPKPKNVHTRSLYRYISVVIKKIWFTKFLYTLSDRCILAMFISAAVQINFECMF